MTEEEKKAAEAAAAQAAKDGEVIDPIIEIDPVTKLQEDITKLTEERDNYKAVALKRLGKLPGDADFLGDGELSVAEQVRLALLDKEIEANKKAEKEATAKIIKENSELRLALKNRPNTSIGSGGESTIDVKDNVLSESQLISLRAKAISLKVDPEKFIENFKKNLRSRQ